MRFPTMREMLSMAEHCRAGLSRKWLASSPDTGFLIVAADGSMSGKSSIPERERQRLEHPVLFFVLETAPDFLKFDLARKISKAKWALLYRFHPRYRYHVIDTGLRPGFHDVDELMLHGMMSLLVRYVEEQEGGDLALEERIASLLNPDNRDPNVPDEYQTDDYADLDRETLAIYQWWKFDRPKAQRELRESYDVFFRSGRGIRIGGRLFGEAAARRTDLPPDFVEPSVLEEALEAKEQEMLLRLVSIRRGLWN